MNNKGQESRKGSAAFLITVRYEKAFYFLHIFNLCSLLIYNSHILQFKVENLVVLSAFIELCKYHHNQS